jgi:hypothetical protein
VNIRSKYKLILVCLIAFAGLAFCYFSNRSGVQESQNGEGFRNLKAQAFELNGGWGYRILQDTTAFIEQAGVPGVPGQTPFRTEGEANSVASLVIQKLNKGIFPPSVTTAELDSLHITYK